MSFGGFRNNLGVKDGTLLKSGVGSFRSPAEFLEIIAKFWFTDFVLNRSIAETLFKNSNLCFSQNFFTEIWNSVWAKASSRPSPVPLLDYTILKFCKFFNKETSSLSRLDNVTESLAPINESEKFWNFEELQQRPGGMISFLEALHFSDSNKSCEIFEKFTLSLEEEGITP